MHSAGGSKKIRIYRSFRNIGSCARSPGLQEQDSWKKPRGFFPHSRPLYPTPPNPVIRPGKILDTNDSDSRDKRPYRDPTGPPRGKPGGPVPPPATTGEPGRVSLKKIGPFTGQSSHLNKTAALSSHGQASREREEIRQKSIHPLIHTRPPPINPPYLRKTASRSLKKDAPGIFHKKYFPGAEGFCRATGTPCVSPGYVFFRRDCCRGMTMLSGP